MWNLWFSLLASILNRSGSDFMCWSCHQYTTSWRLHNLWRQKCFSGFIFCVAVVLLIYLTWFRIYKTVFIIKWIPLNIHRMFFFFGNKSLRNVKPRNYLNNQKFRQFHHKKDLPTRITECHQRSSDCLYYSVFWCIDIDYVSIWLTMWILAVIPFNCCWFPKQNASKWFLYYMFYNITDQHF
jgi:hypothetical protein